MGGRPAGDGALALQVGELHVFITWRTNQTSPSHASQTYSSTLTAGCMERLVACFARAL